MKKWIALMLCLSLCLALGACGKEEEKKDNPFAGVVQSDLDFSGITTYDDVTPATINFTIPEFELDLSNITVYDDVFEVHMNFAPVEVPKIEIESFNVPDFVEESNENLTQEDAEKLETMPAEEVVEIAQVRANLLADLATAFEATGLDVQVDENTGVITLDSTILFAVDQAQVSQEGAELLSNFLLVYTTVVYHERYEGFVSEIVIEGHTDSTGDYNYNKSLSQARAESVKSLCLSEQLPIDAAVRSKLAQALSAVGYACDYPVLDANGNEDLDASRRVSFRFLINVD